MKRLLLVAMSGLLFWTRSMGQAGPELGPLGPFVRSLIANGGSSLVIMPDPQLGDRFWAAWTDDVQDRHAVTLAFLTRESADVSSTWAKTSADGYAPTLSTMGSWTYHDHPIVMLLYQVGAAFAHADLYGLDAGMVPRPLGSLEGALIETEPAMGGERLRVYADALLREAPVCYVWNAAEVGMRKVGCQG